MHFSYSTWLELSPCADLGSAKQPSLELLPGFEEFKLKTPTTWARTWAFTTQVFTHENRYLLVGSRSRLHYLDGCTMLRLIPMWFRKCLYRIECGPSAHSVNAYKCVQCGMDPRLTNWQTCWWTIYGHKCCTPTCLRCKGFCTFLQTRSRKL